MKKRPTVLEVTGELTGQDGLLIVDPHISDYLEAIPDITGSFVKEYVFFWGLHDYAFIEPGHSLFEELSAWALSIVMNARPSAEIHIGDRELPDPNLSTEENARLFIRHLAQEGVYTAQVSGSRCEVRIVLDVENFKVSSLRIPVLTKEAEGQLLIAPVLLYKEPEKGDGPLVRLPSLFDKVVGEYGRTPDGTTYQAKKIKGPAAKKREKVEALFEKLNETQLESRDLASKQGQLMYGHFKAKGGPGPKFTASPSGMIPAPEQGVEYPGIDPEAPPVEQVRLILAEVRREIKDFRDMDARIKELSQDIYTLENEINRTLWGLAFDYWRYHNPVQVEPSVFEGREVAPVPTGGPMWSGVRALMHPSRWEETTEGVLTYQQSFEDGRSVTHFIASAEDLEGRPERLAGEAAWSIVKNFGILTARLHLLFAAHAWDQGRPWEESFTLAGDSMIRDLGLDKRTDLTYLKKLKDVVKHAGLLNNLWVQALWREGGQPFNVRVSRMWDIAFDMPYSQPSLLEDGEEDFSSVTLTVRPGMWTEKFLNRGEGGLLQFGFMAREVLSIDPYHDEMASELAILLTFQARVKMFKGQPMDFKVGTLLEYILGRDLLAEISQDYKKRFDCADRWDRALLTLHDNRWTISFDQATYPEELRPAWALEEDLHQEKRRRPRGYWDKLLRAHILINPPAPVAARLLRGQEEPEPRRLPPPRLTGKDVREARERCGLTQEELAERVGKTQSWIARIERGQRKISPDAERDLREALGI